MRTSRLPLEGKKGMAAPDGHELKQLTNTGKNGIAHFSSSAIGRKQSNPPICFKKDNGI